MQADDLDAFEEFFARYRAPIYRTAYGLTGDPQAAEEILQDTFSRAYQRRSTLRTDVSPLPWLHRVALNLCYSRLAGGARQSEPIEAVVGAVLPTPATAPAERAEQTELRQIVRDGVAGLPEKHRSVVVLYYLHGLSLQETAQLLDVRLGTVKSRLHYALRALRTRLERRSPRSAAPTAGRRDRGGPGGGRRDGLGTIVLRQPPGRPDRLRRASASAGRRPAPRSTHLERCRALPEPTSTRSC